MARTATISERARRIAAVFAIALTALALLPASGCHGRAWAAECSAIRVAGDAVEDASTAPQAFPTPLAVAYFDVRVGLAPGESEYASDEVLAREESNRAKVHLLKGGSPVDGVEVQAVGGKGGAILNMCVSTSEWLSPLTTYRVVVDPGVCDVWTGDAASEGYALEFRTGGLCPDGLTVAENLLVAAAAAMAIAGVAAGIWRARRRR